MYYVSMSIFLDPVVNLDPLLDRANSTSKCSDSVLGRKCVPGYALLLTN